MSLGLGFFFCVPQLHASIAAGRAPPPPQAALLLAHRTSHKAGSLCYVQSSKLVRRSQYEELPCPNRLADPSKSCVDARDLCSRLCAGRRCVSSRRPRSSLPLPPSSAAAGISSPPSIKSPPGPSIRRNPPLLADFTAVDHNLLVFDPQLTASPLCTREGLS